MNSPIWENNWYCFCYTLKSTNMHNNEKESLSAKNKSSFQRFFLLECIFSIPLVSYLNDIVEQSIVFKCPSVHTGNPVPVYCKFLWLLHVLWQDRHGTRCLVMRFWKKVRHIRFPSFWDPAWPDSAESVSWDEKWRIWYFHDHENDNTWQYLQYLHTDIAFWVKRPLEAD